MWVGGNSGSWRNQQKLLIFCIVKNPGEIGCEEY